MTKVKSNKSKTAKQDKATKVKMYSKMPAKATALDQKKFRSKARRSIAKLGNAVITADLSKGKKGLPAAIKAFNSHYKSQYILNDFSIGSIYTGKNEVKVKDLSRALKLCKGSMAKG